MATDSLDKRTKGATNEHLRQIYNTNNQCHMPKRRGPIKKHNCLNSDAKSELSLKTGNLHSRPSTRRHPNATPKAKDPLSALSYSLGPISKSEKMFKFKQKKRRLVRSPSHTSEGQLNLLQEVGEIISEQGTPAHTERSILSKESGVLSHKSLECMENKPVVAESFEEHEYLLFLLRITEDIISNDFYSNIDIKKIFKSHIELNKGRLNMRKMRVHIDNLCQELNIDCKDFQTQETGRLDSPRPLFQNSPNGHKYVLNNEAFKNCQDCSVIRTSSLYNLPKAREEDYNFDDRLIRPSTENPGDNSSSSPSLLKLLEKLSLGRVTECTEPAASASTINSPHPDVPKNVEMNTLNKPDNSPMDFETFVEELNSKELILSDRGENDRDVIALESPPVELDITVTSRSVLDNTEAQLKNSTTNVDHSVLSPANLESPTTPSVVCNKSEIDLSEKYDSEFEKCSSNNSLLTSRHTSENNKEDAKEYTFKTETENVIVGLKESPKSEDNNTNLMNENTAKAEPYLEENVETNVVPPLKFAQNEQISLTKINQLPSRSKSIINDTDITYINTKEEEVNNKPDGSLNKKTTETTADDQNSPLKIILQGPVSNNDYVMIKGPLYVYKPLLDSNPKLIVFSDNEDQKSRRNSLDSQRSNRTFTVDHSHVQDHVNVDQGVQYDDLHSLEYDTSMENILELTKTAYSQFMDIKLLQSDYDLTPEKDGSDNKYHHLLEDATTSVSGINITENLLLNDEYLVKTGLDKSFFSSNDSFEESKVKINGGSNIGNEIDSYHRKFQAKMYENNYVIHRRLMSSVSMPKLKLDSERSTSNRSFVRRNEDLIAFNVPSQDSSLRSEGEAAQIIESTKRGISWDPYNK